MSDVNGENVPEMDENPCEDKSCLDVKTEENIDASEAVGESCSDHSSVPSVPVYDFENIPIQVTGAWKEFESPVDNYLRGCKWSPDGSCLMACSNDNIIRLFNLPEEVWNENFNWSNMKEMMSVLKVSEGVCIYDYCWYPLMSSYNPLTCCFCSTSKESPVHLWDAFTGELRCSYRSYDQVDELTTPHSVAFDLQGQMLFCGFNKMIRIFNVAIPGRICIERPTYAAKYGQYGIISCFAFSPTNPNISVAGSFSKTIGIYSEPDGELEHLLSGHQGGLTHICFSPDGTRIYSGARKDLEILCWDMRNLSTPLYSMRRKCLTSQRMYFDISKCGRFLVTGNQNGIVSVWDTTKEPKEVASLPHPVLEPIQYFAAHNDSVNGVSFHSTLPFFATCSGERKFPEPADSDDETDMFSSKPVSRENSIRLWCAPKF